MFSIGFDIGSSSIKGTILDLESGKIVTSTQYPDSEMEIYSPESGWAEQHPIKWWESVKKVTAKLLQTFTLDRSSIKYIGISYQMHGLVLVDKNGKVLRPSIIWCDSRAVETGEQILDKMGQQFCLENYLNSPGNFTLSKLKWVKDNEPEIYSKIHKIMLPGDYIAMRLTGEIVTTKSGLSEGIMWNFKNDKIAYEMLEAIGISKDLLPDIVDTFSNQGKITNEFANEFGLNNDVEVCYRAGDQPNNAFSLNVLNPGEIAATAGTSGVVYGVSETITYDPQSRVNTFAHVNHQSNDSRLGILLCINGCGITNSWVKKNIGQHDYDEINKLAANIPIGSDGLKIIPFGNGAERMLENKNHGCSILGLDYNRHFDSHIYRATLEAVAFSFCYGMEIMKEMGIDLQVIRAGYANMFQSPVFRETLSNVNQSVIELYNTDGSVGAARGAGIGGGFYKNNTEAFENLKIIESIEPNNIKTNKYLNVYTDWKNQLEKYL